MNENVMNACCGAISGIITNFFTHPIDTIKSRMQTDPKIYKGIFSTALFILNNEKFFGFYKGIFANTLANVPVASVQFMVYGKYKRYFKEKKYFKSKYANYFISGCIAGISTLPFVVPLEMIKCNQQVNFQGKTKKENRFIKKTSHIFRKTGVIGFYRGFFAAANRDIISTGLYFLTYYGIKSQIKSKYKFVPSTLTDLSIGAFTGWLTWIVTYPFDTVKTIIQVSPLNKSSRSQKQVFSELLHLGGVRELYRGALPAMTLSIMFTSLTFLFFEISRKVFVQYLL